MSQVMEFEDFDHPLLFRHSGAKGRIGLISGEPGSGKSSYMAYLAKRILDLHPRELVFYRWTPQQCQWKYVEPSQALLLLQGLPELNYVIVDKAKRQPINPEDLGIKVKLCYEPQDFLLKAEPGKVNFIFHLENDKKFFIDFCQALLNRFDNRWITIFYDEASHLMPTFPKGKDWKLIAELFVEKMLGEFREAKISFIAACHDFHQNLFWGYRSKVQYYCLLKGAKPPKGCMLKFKAFEQPGVVWITSSSEYGFHRFPEQKALGDFMLSIQSIFDKPLEALNELQNRSEVG